VGEADADGVDIAVTPWPSDHRAVLSGFEVEPAPMPEIIATDRRVYEAGEVVEFTYRSSTSAQPAIVLERATEPGLVTPRIRLTAPAQSGTVRLPDAELAAGHYEVSLLDPAGFAASRNEFWILAPDALPTLEVAGDHFTVGEPLPFHWSGAPGNRYDWIGIFPAPNEDTHRSSPAAPNEDTHRSSPANGDANGDTHQSLSPADGLIEGAQEYLAYGYVDARSSGQLLLGPETVETDWPLPPGRYVARLLLHHGYVVLADASPFTDPDYAPAPAPARGEWRNEDRTVPDGTDPVPVRKRGGVQSLRERGIAAQHRGAAAGSRRARSTGSGALALSALHRA
jgi:hypothetical protein